MKKYKGDKSAFTAPDADLALLTPHQRSDGKWVISTGEGRYLHFIESVDNSPYWVSRADMTMSDYNFKEEVDALIDWLKRLWNENPEITASMFDKLRIKVEISNLKGEKDDVDQ